MLESEPELDPGAIVVSPVSSMSGGGVVSSFFDRFSKLMLELLCCRGLKGARAIIDE